MVPPRYLSWLITPIIGFMVDIPILNGGYKPTYSWGGHHLAILDYMSIVGWGLPQLTQFMANLGSPAKN